MVDLKKKALSLPMSPGVYIMMDRRGAVIYVGKAKLLRNRVSQYFQDSASHSEKTRNMVSQVSDFDTIIVDDEFEALLVENSLIKRHMPRYNILLKDGKGYPFIRVGQQDEFPRITMEPKIMSDGARYFGPYGGRFVTRQVIDAVSGALRLPTCAKVFPGDIGKGRVCLNYHMGRCLAPCAAKISKGDYGGLVRQAVMLLEGRFESVLEDIKTEMEAAAEELRFEKAAQLRDRYTAIISLKTKQKVVTGSFSDTDVIGFYTNGVHACAAVLHFIEGALLERDLDMLPETFESTDAAVLGAYVRQYYLQRSTLPKEIILPFEIEDMDALSKLLSREAGGKVAITAPKKGKKLDLSRMAVKNAREEAERVTSAVQRVNKTLGLLQNALGIEEFPKRIEAFDISNFSGQDIVASMVVFVGGSPLKRDYRRFAIKGARGQDDYLSMRETLSRRFKNYLEGDAKFSALPDLVLVDGGYAHAKAGKEVVSGLGLGVPVFGMVKDSKHRTRAIVSPDGREIGIDGNTALFSFVGRIQEEAHRFAIDYQKKKRAKRQTLSSLDGIGGVGEKRKAALLRHFKSIAAIKGASLEELGEVLPRDAAKAVFGHFKDAEER